MTRTNEPAATNPPAVSIGQGIDATLEARRAAPNTTLRRLEDAAKSAGEPLLQKHPYAGVAGLGAMAATRVGLGELGNGAYNVITGRETPIKACKQVV
jgi:hypothetical protein